jgi:hypothetical protein
MTKLLIDSAVVWQNLRSERFRGMLTKLGDSLVMFWLGGQIAPREAILVGEVGCIGRVQFEQPSTRVGEKHLRAELTTLRERGLSNRRAEASGQMRIGVGTEAPKSGPCSPACYVDGFSNAGSRRRCVVILAKMCSP